jgi:hypothetical protein
VTKISLDSQYPLMYHTYIVRLMQYLIVFSVGLRKLLEGKLEPSKCFAPFNFQYFFLSFEIFLSIFTKTIWINSSSSVFVRHIFLNFIFNSLKTYLGMVVLHFLENICDQALSLILKSVTSIDTGVIQQIVTLL